MHRAALFSPCRTFRWLLVRRWSDAPPVLFMGLNPSTADGRRDDPTSRRCIDFARRWGHGGLLLGNLYAYRATKPPDLRAAGSPEGRHNRWWLQRAAEVSGRVVVAWGNDGHGPHSFRVAAGLPGVVCLGRTKRGAPRHPLYVRADTVPVPWSPPEDPSTGVPPESLSG
jgi:hypothetical protein